MDVAALVPRFRKLEPGNWREVFNRPNQPRKAAAAIIMFTIEEMPQKDGRRALAAAWRRLKWHVCQGPSG